MADDKGFYARFSAAIEQKYLPGIHAGMRFTKDDVIRYFRIDQLRELSETDKAVCKTEIGKVLYNWSIAKNPRIRQVGKFYRVVDKSVEELKWWEADAGEKVIIHWPRDHSDLDTSFGFDESVIMPPGNIALVAGDTNAGKSSFCLNVLLENCDHLKCTYMSSELNASEFARRIKPCVWADAIGIDGQPKFTVIRRTENWVDVLDPDGLNIIDWVSMGENSYMIQDLHRQMKRVLDKGIVVMAIQKPKGRDLGYGKDFTIQEVAFAVSISYDDEQRHNVLKVLKVKTPAPDKPNPSYKKFTFWIKDEGINFYNINDEGAQ